MSVQTEINRIESAKTAIATAIAGKGVTVPSGTKLDGMAALIRSIVASGGAAGGVTMSKLGEGTFTGTGELEYTLNHGLGVTPKAVVLIRSGTITTNQLLLGVVVNVGDKRETYGIFTKTSTTTFVIMAYSYMVGEWDENLATLKVANSPYVFPSGKTFTWKAYA